VKGNSRIHMAAHNSYRQEDVYFVKASGIGHLISSAGDRLSFEYDENNNLTTIVDQFGNWVTINRAFGVPTAKKCLSLMRGRSKHRNKTYVFSNTTYKTGNKRKFRNFGNYLIRRLINFFFSLICKIS
jgi:hypothetical protein